MRQNRTDHRAPQNGGPDDLTTGQPEQCRANKLDNAGDLAKSLTEADLVEGCDHHLDPSELGATCANKCKGQQDAKAEGKIGHGFAPTNNGCLCLLNAMYIMERNAQGYCT